MTRVARWLVCAGAAALVALHLAHHPHAAEPWPPAALLAPSLGKLWTLVRTLLALAAVDGAALIVGAPLVRRLGASADRLLAPVGALAAGLLVLAYAVLALAALHLLVAPALALLVAAPILVAAPRLARRVAALPRPRPRALWWAALLLAPPLFGAFVPTWGWDALTYHLALPERWLWTGRIWFSPLSLFSAFPLDGEMLYTLALPLGGAALCKLVDLQFGVLALIAVAALARRHSPRAVLFALALPLADPLFHWELGVVYTDLALALLALLAVEALIAWDGGDARAIRRAALFAGACAGLRYPGVVVPLALAAVALAGARRHGLGRALVAVAWLGGGALALLLPWLVRNAVFTGNPFAPALQRWFGDYFDPFVVAEQVAFTRSVGCGHGLGALLLLPWNLFVRARAGDYSGGFGFAVGPLYLVGAVAALAAAAVRRDRAFRLPLAAAGLLALVWFATAQEARYLLPALLLVAVAGGAALAELSRGRAATVACALVCAVAVAWAQWPAVRALPLRWALAGGAADPDAFERAADESAWMGAELRRTLAPGDRVLLLLEPRGWSFRGLDYLPYHVLEGAPALRWVHDAPDAHALRCRLARLGVTHVVVNLGNARRFHPVPLPGYGALDYAADLGKLRAFLQAWAEPMIEHAGVVAARLRPVQDCPAP